MKIAKHIYIGFGVLQILLTSSAIAQPSISFGGTSIVQGKQLPLKIRLSCVLSHDRNTTGALSIRLEIPIRLERSMGVNLEPFDGPGATASGKLLTTIRSIVSGTTESATLSANSYTGVDPNGATVYSLETSASLKRGDPALRSLDRVLGPLTTKSGTLVWEQRGVTSGDKPFQVLFEIPIGFSAELKPMISDCLAYGK